MSDHTRTVWKDRFDRFLWWTPPISFLADVIAIVSVFTTKEPVSQPTANSQQSPQVFIAWGGLALSDAVFITGVLTLLAITLILYGGYLVYKAQGTWWRFILASFASLMLTYLYFRLWLGENWWIYVGMFIFLVALVGLAVISSIFSSNSSSGYSGQSLITSPITPSPSEGNQTLFLSEDEIHRLLNQQGQVEPLPSNIDLTQLLTNQGQEQSQGEFLSKIDLSQYLNNQGQVQPPIDTTIFNLLNQSDQSVSSPLDQDNSSLDWTNTGLFTGITPLFPPDDKDPK